MYSTKRTRASSCPARAPFAPRKGIDRRASPASRLLVFLLIFRIMNDRLPEVGQRVLAFHPVARVWRPATVLATTAPDLVRVNFMFYAQSENIAQFLASDHQVRWPEEVEPL